MTKAIEKELLVFLKQATILLKMLAKLTKEDLKRNEQA